VIEMAKVIFDKKEMSIGERDRQIKEIADFTKAVSREEARSGTTTTDENDLTFFKEG